MRALRWHARGDVRCEEVADAPPPGAGQVRVTVDWCGICVTDVEEFTDGPLVIPQTTHPHTGFGPPIIIGHEVAGRVESVGSGVRGLEPGQLVALDGVVFCGECRACRRGEPNVCEKWAHIGMGWPGGLAEAITVPSGMVVPALEDVAPDELALAEPFAVAARAVRQGRLVEGETALVIGAGTIGLCVLQVLRARGAASVLMVDPVPFRRDLAKRLGASAAVAAMPPDIADAAEAERVDLIFDCTGSEATIGEALPALRTGGRCVLVGLPPRPSTLDLLPLVLREYHLIGTVGHVADVDARAAVDLICSRRVRARELITHRLPLEDGVDKGIAFLAGPDRGDALKILISPKL